jgi:hypothetical protein
MNRTAVISFALCCIVEGSQAQDLEITSFDHNGNLTWTNSVSNATYRIEWSPSLKDGWNTNSPFEAISGTGFVMSAKVPMFYRVMVVDPNHSISGMVFYSTNPLPNRVVNLYTPDWTVINSATSGLDGHYILTGVTNGAYWIGYGSDATYLGGWRDITVQGQNIAYDYYTVKRVTLLSPEDGSSLSSTQPTFSWVANPEADHYTFQMNVTTNWQLVDFVHGVASNTYQTASILSNGVQYTWQVDAIDAEGNYVGGTDHSFSFTVQQ